MPDSQSKQLIEKLSKSKIYQDYEKAFTSTTGLPLSIRPTETWQMAHQGRKNQNPFCMIMAESSRSCAACLQTQQVITEKGTEQPHTTVCFAGLCDTGVPIRSGEKLLGFLQTGQVFMRKPTREQFDRTTRQLLEWGLTVDLKQLEEAYFHTNIVSQKQYDSILRLLTIFSEHLSIVANQIMVQEQNAEPPMISRAKEFIQDHQGEDLSLGSVSKAVNTSTFYFCKMFKKATGLHFTEYLSLVRIEKAKNLLLNPNLRISEIAYEVGFQSLTHFNRVFRKLVGMSPSEYRDKLPGFNARKGK